MQLLLKVRWLKMCWKKSKNSASLYRRVTSHISLYLCVLLKCFSLSAVDLSCRSHLSSAAMSTNSIKIIFKERIWLKSNHIITTSCVRIWPLILVACHLCLFKWSNKLLLFISYKTVLATERYRHQKMPDLNPASDLESDWVYLTSGRVPPL